MARLGKTPFIKNLSIPSADTEVFYVIPTGTKKYIVQCRTDDVLKFAYVAGESGTVFATIPEGASMSEDNLNTGPGLTIYLQSPTAGVVAEITTWST